MIRKSILLCSLTLSLIGYAQQTEVQVPLTPDAWEHNPENVAFVTHRSVPAVQPKTDGAFRIELKDFEFTNGTIEFDVEFTGRGFPGIGFRHSDDLLNGEFFYIRYFGTVNPLSRYTLQYASIIDGINMWDMTDDYQAAATINDNAWNHVKLVISGKQMKVYVNDMDKVALHVPALESGRASGSIYLTGSVIYSNMVIRPGATEALPEVAGYDPTYSDTRYLKNWSVTGAVDLPFEKDIFKGVPRPPGVVIDSTLLAAEQWQPLKAERRGIVNLTRKFGATENGNRRLVWVKTNITSDLDQVRKLHLGFSDEVWVLLDGKPLYVDKNYYGSPGMKEPRGRSTIENSTITLPLKEGNNELLIGVANYFFGWGLIARLDATDNLTLE